VVAILPIHAMLHIADGIHHHGPVCMDWTWVMEWYCGVLGTVAASKGRSNVNATLPETKKMLDT